MCGRFALFSPAEAAQALLAPCPDTWLSCHPVASLVGNPRIDDPRCIQPVHIPLNESLW